MRRALLFKSCSKYWPRALLAIESARRWNPTYDVHVITDEFVAPYYPAEFHYGPVYGEKWISVAQAPMIMKLLASYDEVYFVDSDTYTYGPYKEAEEELSKGASILVTPHVTRPLPIEKGSPNLLQIAKVGNYNAGWVAATPTAIPFLQFVSKWTAEYPYMDDENYIGAEQSWLRFACDFDERAKVFRHPGYNWAYWNAIQRPLSRASSGELLADALPLRMAHFSGMTPDLNPNKMSRYQNRDQLSPDSLEYQLFADYQKQMVAGGGVEPPTPAL